MVAPPRQHVLIVIALEVERVDGADDRAQIPVHVADVGADAEAVHAVVDDEDRAVDRVVRRRERLDGDAVAEAHRVAGAEMADVGDHAELRAPVRRRQRALGDEDGEHQLAREDAGAAHVIGVLVRNEEGVDAHRDAAAGGEARVELGARESGVEQEAQTVRLDVEGVAVAAGL